VWLDWAVRKVRAPHPGLVTPPKLLERALVLRTFLTRMADTQYFDKNTRPLVS
jgi:hypothetical protein